MKTIFLSINFLLIAIAGLAQSAVDKPSIALMARGYADHVLLRYFPTTPALLNKGNIVGYVIERAVFKQGIALEKQNFVAVKGAPVKRWSDDQWERNITALDKADTTNIKIAGFAMTVSDEHVQPAADVLSGGLQSLMKERDDQDMKFAMVVIAANQSKIAAEGLALSIADNDVNAGLTYIYRVRVNDPAENTKAGMAYIKVACGVFNQRYLFDNKVIMLGEFDTKVTFSFPESKDYYAFDVDRSDDDGATYKRITNTPAFKLTPHGYKGKTDFGFTDSNLVNYKKYKYRVMVATPFADELPLAEFTATPRDRTPPPSPFLKSATHTKPKQVELIWETTAVADLKGFNIRRSSAFRGKYNLISKSILPTSARSYIDETFDVEGENYYIVDAIDTAGNIGSSFAAYVTLIDSIPPAVPVITSAKIDTAGKIIIKIKPNTEKDFIGYQLLKANAPDHEFSTVSETYRDSLGRKIFILKDSTTLNTLTKKIYYKVVAFDSHYNQSVPSKIIELTKRDTIPPVPPLITGFMLTDTTVVLNFANSTSEDAVSNILMRRETGKPKFDTLFVNTNQKVTAFIDKKITGGREYEYAMIAKDDGGLKSKVARSVVLKTILNNRLTTPTLNGLYDAAAKKVSLSFLVDDKLKNRKLKVELYKRSNTTSSWLPYKQVDFVPGKNLLDNADAGNQSAYYTIRLVDENKNSSNFSNELEIAYQ